MVDEKEKPTTHQTYPTDGLAERATLRSGESHKQRVGLLCEEGVHSYNQPVALRDLRAHRYLDMRCGCIINF